MILICLSLQEKYQQEQERLKQEWEKAQREVEEEERKHHEEVHLDIPPFLRHNSYNGADFFHVIILN